MHFHGGITPARVDVSRINGPAYSTNKIWTGRTAIIHTDPISINFARSKACSPSEWSHVECIEMQFKDLNEINKKKSVKDFSRTT